MWWFVCGKVSPRPDPFFCFSPCLFDTHSLAGSCPNQLYMWEIILTNYHHHHLPQQKPDTPNTPLPNTRTQANKAILRYNGQERRRTRAKNHHTRPERKKEEEENCALLCCCRPIPCPSPPSPTASLVTPIPLRLAPKRAKVWVVAENSWAAQNLPNWGGGGGGATFLRADSGMMYEYYTIFF